MTHSHLRHCLLAAVLISSLGPLHRALGAEPTGFYVGANLGEARNDYRTRFVDDQVEQGAADANSALEDTKSVVKRNAHAWWVEAGYLPWSQVGFEAAFLHLAELTHRFSGTVHTPLASLPFISTATVTSAGPALLLLARLPLAGSVELDARVGDYLAKTVLKTGFDFHDSYSVDSTSGTKSSLAASLGLAWTVADHWSLRMDYLRVHRAGDSRTGSYDMDLATAGIAFVF